MTLDLKAILARAEAASPGPWHATESEAEPSLDERLCRAHEHEGRFTVSRDADRAGWRHDGGYDGYGLCGHDAVFIAAARTDVVEMAAFITVLADALRSIGKNTCGCEALAAAYARGVLEEQGLDTGRGT